MEDEQGVAIKNPLRVFILELRRNFPQQISSIGDLCLLELRSTRRNSRHKVLTLSAGGGRTGDLRQKSFKGFHFRAKEKLSTKNKHNRRFVPFGTIPVAIVK